jgi:membrane protein DedA with SNARE-associated domain
MHAHAGLIAFLHASLSSPVVTACAIAFAVLFQEDVTTVAVGMMAAEQIVPVPLAMISLLVGTLLNDFGLYGIGRLAITHPRLRRWVEHEKRLPLRTWLNGRLIPTVMAVQFMPGMRLPTFVACGFFALSFRRFALAIVPAVVVWSPLAFTCAYFYGEFTAKLIGFWQWPIAFAAVIGVGFAASLYWKRTLSKSGDSPAG